MWTYDQLSGALGKDGQQVATGGYSGFGQGKNNPDMENVPDVGPIPRGIYDIGPIHDTTTHGPHVMALTPEPGTDTLGRDGFLIHGDSVENPGTASHGCIILPRTVRDQISASGDTQIQVVCAAEAPAGAAE
ncbi:MAG: tlde1 domain-containing protein [Candidatus Solibacter sp.]|jgi:hypothetical protein